MRTFIDRAWRLLGSSGLASILLLLLLLLTFLGTVEQVNQGLFEVQKKYFESPALVHYLFGVIPIPLPGVYLLLMVFSVNLIIGGVIRVRRKWARIGILVAHLGILFLLIAGFISLKSAWHGHVTLYEGETSSEFVSHYDWELAISKVPAKPGGEFTEMVIPTNELDALAGKEAKTFKGEALPFDLVLSDYLLNCWPKSTSQNAPPAPGQLDGILLEERPLDNTAEANVRGVRVVVKEKGADKETETLLWGRQRYPFTVTVAGDRYAIDLRKVHKPLPFSVTLDEFIHEKHPRTNMPKVFMSKVTKTEDGIEQGVRISMNQPLRHKGYTLYQSSWGPPDARPGDKLFSVFAVVRNPADQLPLWATVVICLGMLYQFMVRLVKYLVSEAEKR